jgi:hypothetical protein
MAMRGTPGQAGTPCIGEQHPRAAVRHHAGQLVGRGAGGQRRHRRAGAQAAEEQQGVSDAVGAADGDGLGGLTPSRCSPAAMRSTIASSSPHVTRCVPCTSAVCAGRAAACSRTRSSMARKGGSGEAGLAGGHGGQHCAGMRKRKREPAEREVRERKTKRRERGRQGVHGSHRPMRRLFAKP